MSTDLLIPMFPLAILGAVTVYAWLRANAHERRIERLEAMRIRRVDPNSGPAINPIPAADRRALADVGSRLPMSLGRIAVRQ